MGSTRADPARALSPASSWWLLEEGEGWGSHSIPSPWSKPTGSEDVSEGSPGLLWLPAHHRGCHFQGNQALPAELSSTEAKQLWELSGERERCGQSCLPAAANGTVHTRASRAGRLSRATSTPQPLPGILSPTCGFLSLTFAKSFVVLEITNPSHVKGSGTWRVPQQLFLTGANPALLRSLREGGRR